MDLGVQNSSPRKDLVEAGCANSCRARIRCPRDGCVREQLMHTLSTNGWRCPMQYTGSSYAGGSLEGVGVVEKGVRYFDDHGDEALLLLWR